MIFGDDSRVDFQSAQAFLGRPETVHVKQFVCRPNAWNYGLKIRTIEDCSHIVEQRDAMDWGRR